MPQEHNGFLVAFKTFQAVEDSCFGAILDPFYKDIIDDFIETYEKLNLSITTKVRGKETQNGQTNKLKDRWSEQ